MKRIDNDKPLSFFRPAEDGAENGETKDREAGAQTPPADFGGGPRLLDLRAMQSVSENAAQTPEESGAYDAAGGVAAAEAPETGRSPQVLQMPQMLQIPRPQQGPQVQRTPQGPQAQQVPQVQRTPQGPQAPQGPQTPHAQETQQTQQTPQIQQAPHPPQAQQAPQTQWTPQGPQAPRPPQAQQVPPTPQTQQTPQAQRWPDAEAASGTPETWDTEDGTAAAEAPPKPDRPRRKFSLPKLFRRKKEKTPAAPEAEAGAESGPEIEAYGVSEDEAEDAPASGAKNNVTPFPLAGTNTAFRDRELPDLGKKKRGRLSFHVRTVLAGVVTVALVAAAVLAFIYRDRLSTEGLRGLFSGGSLSVIKSEAFTYEIGAGQVFAPAGNGLAVASSSAIELLNADGTSVFKQVVSYGTPSVCACDSSALFCDLGGKSCVLARTDGQSLAYTPEGDILTASMNENGWFALTTDAVGYKGLVTVCDSAGEARYQWWSGAGYVLKALVSPDNRFLAVLCAQTGGGRLHILRMESSEEYALAVFDEELPFDLSFMGESICTVSEDAVSFLSLEGELRSRFPLDESYLLDYDLSSPSFAAVCVNAYRAGRGGEIITLDREGRELGRAAAARDVTSLSAVGRQLLVLTAGSLSVYNQDMGVLYHHEELMTAKRAILLPDRTILLLSSYAAQKVGY